MDQKKISHSNGYYSGKVQIVHFRLYPEREREASQGSTLRAGSVLQWTLRRICLRGPHDISFTHFEHWQFTICKRGRKKKQPASLFTMLVTHNNTQPQLQAENTWKHDNISMDWTCRCVRNMSANVNSNSNKSKYYSDNVLWESDYAAYSNKTVRIMVVSLF